jgi:hypothetical protein
MGTDNTDVLGKEVTVLFNGRLNTGTYELPWDANNFSSGVYYYKLISGDYRKTKN